MSKLLVVIGALEDEDYVKHVVKCVATGIDEWLRPSPLHSKEEIENILNSIPLMKSIPNRNAENGSVVSRFKGRILDTTILINPTLENLHYEFIDLLRTASHCLVAFGGFASEREGDWILQDGLFSLDNILHTLKDSKVLTSISVKKTKIAISCHKIGQWKKESMNTVDQDIHLEIIDSSCQENGGEGDAMNTNNRENHIGEFTSFLEDGIANEIDTIFNSLKPPCREGFIKTSNPCLYIFPGGHGDSAFFAINGFNMLVNGGSTCKPSFWKLIQHIDRVDSILATHLGVDNLPGINSFLMRKLQERQIKLPIDNTTEDYQELRRCLISPNLGPMFFNAPVQFFESLPKSSPRKNIAKPDNDEFKLPNGSQDQLIFKASDVVKDTIRLSKALNLQLKPLRRKPGLCEPITLFSKFGCGKLDMYVLNPIDGSKELKYMNEKWGIGGQTEIPFGKNGVSDPSGVEGMSSYADLCSISVLLVWHPSDPNERIVRVLFPGNASQSKIFEGLEGINELPFMKMQHATGNTIQEARVASKMTETVPAQKSSRPASSTARVGISQRRLVSGKKSTLGSMGSLVKESSTCEVKTSDKRPKNDKTMTKPKAVAAVPSKTVPAKDKAVTTKSARSATGQVSSKAATAVPASSSTAKKVQSTAGNKSEAKRPASAKSSTLKTKPTEKTTERSKKPVPVVHKTKVETSKTSVRKSPRQAPKKPTCTKIPHEKVSKKTKATPPPPPAVEAIPIENISADMDKPTMKTTGSPIKDSEEVSVLPMRRSPEGGDASPPRYIAPSTVEITELDEPQPLSSEQVVKSDTGVANRQFATIPSISEESDMISTNGSSALTMQRTPVGDTTFASDVIKLEEQFLSSDKSITDEHQDQGEIDEIVPSSIELSGKDAEEDPVRITDPVDCNEGLLPDCESLGCAVEAATSPIAAAHDTCVIGAIQSKGSGCDKAIGESEASEPGASEPDAKVEVSMPFVDTGDNNPQGQDLGSDMHSLSSVEGSYELYPVAKSPAPVSTQETIAETISEFKLDEPVLKTEEHCTVADSKLHQMEEAEDQAVCTEELDTHVDSTTWLSGSAVARIDPPFTSTDVSHSLQEAVPQQEFDLCAKSTEHEQVEENFDLHSSQVGENKASKDTEPDYMAVQDCYERDEFQVMQGYSPSHEASSPGMYDFDSKVSEGDDNLLHAGFDSQLSDPEAELLLATEREFDEALLQGADIKDYEPVKSSTLQISDCSEPGVAEEFNLHGGDEPEFSQERGMAEGASFGDPDKQALMSGGTQEAETSGQQINILACADPLAPLADTNELETDILQSDTRKFDSPLNASALPFIPSTMQSDPLRPDDVNQGEEMLITTDAMRGTAPMVSTTSTNPFLMEILADSQPTQLEPKEVIAPPTRGSDPCAGQDKFGKSSVKKSSARKAPFSHIYVDLAYVPNHGDKSSVGPEFFKKIRARYYVISGSKQSCDQPSTEVLNHLLQGRKLWFSESGETASHEDSNVTVIPTHDTPSMKEWYNNNFKELENYNIHMVASGSKVLMQAESIEACKIEF